MLVTLYSLISGLFRLLGMAVIAVGFFTLWTEMQDIKIHLGVESVVSNTGENSVEALSNTINIALTDEDIQKLIELLQSNIQNNSISIQGSVKSETIQN